MSISESRAVQIQVATKAVLGALRNMARQLPGRMREDFSTFGRFALSRFVAMRLLGLPGLRRRTRRLSKSFRAITRGKSIADTELHFVTTSPYAPMHEFGKNPLLPRRARMLAIPFAAGSWHPVTTPAGAYKLGKQPLQQALSAAFRDYSFFVAGKLSTGKAPESKRRSRRVNRVNNAKTVPKVGTPRSGPPKKSRRKRLRSSGPLFLWGVKKNVRPGSKAATPRPFFTLKRSVVIRPRLKFFKTIEGYMRVLWERLNKSAGDVIDGR